MANPTIIDGTNTGLVTDQAGPNIINLGTHAVRVVAQNGADTINGGIGVGAGDVTVVATNNTNPIVVYANDANLTYNPSDGAQTVVAGSATSTVIAPPNNGETDGRLYFVAGSGSAVVDGSQAPTVVGGSGGSVTLIQNGPATVLAGLGTITVQADGSAVSVRGADGNESHSFTFASGDTVAISADGQNVTTVTDQTSGQSYVMVHQVTATVHEGGGAVSEQSGPTYFVLDNTPATVTAAAYQDTVVAGAGDATVDATGNTKLVEIHAGSGALTVIPGAGGVQVFGGTGTVDIQAASGGVLPPVIFVGGSGNATIAGGGSGTDVIRGGSGAITLAQHGDTAIIAGQGAITMTADGNGVFITGADGLSFIGTPDFQPQAGDTVRIASDSSQNTWVEDNVSHQHFLLSGGAANPVTPTVTVSTVAGDDVVNRSEAQAGITISGTTQNVDDGQTVAVTIHDGVHPDIAATAVVSNGVWSVGGIDATGLADGAVTVHAAVSDFAGNSTSYDRAITVDETAPLVAISQVTGDGRVNAAEMAAGFTVSGVATGADGQPIDVVIVDQALDVVQHSTATVTGDLWSVTVPSSPALADGTYAVRAMVSDAAGNPSNLAIQPFTVDQTAPTITIDTVAGDDVINAGEDHAGYTISGTTSGVEDGQTVTIQVANHTYTTTVTNNAWSWNVPGFLNLGDGPLTITADVSDAAGNPAQTATRAVTVDETAPTLTIDSAGGTDHWVNIAEAGQGVAIGGTTDAEIGQQVTVTVSDGGPIWTDTVQIQNPGTWSVTMPDTVPLVDGHTYTVSAQVADAAGNQTSASTFDFTADLSPPIITEDPLPSGGVLNADTAAQGLTITGSESGADGQPVSVTITGPHDVTESFAATVSGGDWSVATGDLSALADGTYTVTATVADAAGNPATTTKALVIDQTAPVIALSTVAGDDVINAAELAGSITVTGTTNAEDGQSVTVSVRDESNMVLWSGTAQVAGGAWSVAVPNGIGLTDGHSYSFTATVDDAAGNHAAPASRMVTVDSSAPTISITDAAIDDKVSAAEASGGFVVSGVAVGAEPGQTVSVAFVDAGDHQIGGTFTGTVTAGGTWSVAVPALPAMPDGGYFVQATVADRAGNTSEPALLPVAVDTTPPVITVTSIDSGRIVNASDAASGFAITGTTDAENGQIVTVTLLDGGGTPVGTYTGAVLNGAWSVTVPSAAALPDGAYVVRASVNDLAGNTSAPATLGFAVDQTPPTLSVLNVGQNGLVNAQQAQAGFVVVGTATGADGQPVQVSIEDAQHNPIGSPVTAMTLGTMWFASEPGGLPLADGQSYTVTVTASDMAGNPAQPVSASFAVDETPPQLAIADVNGGRVLNAAAAASGFTVSGTTTGAEDGQTVTIGFWLDSALAGSATATVEGGAWSATVPASTHLGDGAYSVTADVTDRAGNPAQQATAALIVDETAPTLGLDAANVVVDQAQAQAGLSISGTTDAEDGQQVTLRIVDGLNRTVATEYAVVSDHSFTVMLPSGDVPPDGQYLLEADVTDAAGNPATEAVAGLTIDTAPPTLGIDPLQPVSTATGAGFVISGTTDAEDGQPVSITILSGATARFTDTVRVENGHWSASVPGSLSLDEGVYALQIGVTDAAGNPTAALVPLLVDNTPPVVSIDPVGEVNASRAALGVVVTGSTDAEDGQTVTIRVLDGHDGVLDTETATVTAGRWSVTIPSSVPLPDGFDRLTADVTDVAGNPATQAIASFLVDETPPEVSISQVAANGWVNAALAQTGFTISGSAIGAEPGQTVTVDILDGDTAVETATAQVQPDGSWSASFGDGLPLADGATYAVSASVVDAAGNSATPASASLTVDETAPGITITHIAGDGVVNAAEAQSGFTVSGTSAGAQAGQIVAVTLMDGDTPLTSGTGTIAEDGSWSVSLAGGLNLTDGATYGIQAVVADAAGNQATATGGLSADLSAPSIELAPAPTLDQPGSFGLGGTTTGAEDGQPVAVRIVDANGNTVASFTTTVQSGGWQVTVPATVPLVDGQYTVTADVSDAAGNPASQASEPLTVSLGVSGTVDPLSPETSNPLVAALQQQLASVLGQGGQLAFFQPGQDQPSYPGAVPALLVTPTAGTRVTVPNGAPVVQNQLPGADIQGNGGVGQFIISSTGFTFHSNGGSGVVLADDAQAGGQAGDNLIQLPDAGGGNFLVQTGSGNDTIQAGSGADTIAAGGGQNLIFLGQDPSQVLSAGADTVVSGAGAATVDATAGSTALVFGGSGTLNFMGGSGAATVVGGSGAGTMTGGSGDVVFWGSGSGGNVMTAGTGASTVVGGGSGNLIHANGSGDQLLVAGTGNSTLVGGNATGNNMYWGSNGDDVIQTDAGNDTVIGGAGHDTVQLGSGNALLFGNNDGETFVAGSGAGTIVSGAGGPNTFAFVAGQAGGTEIIWGFRPGTDTLALSGYDPGELGRAMGAVQSFGVGSAIALSDGTHIIFGDVAPPSLANLA